MSNKVIYVDCKSSSSSELYDFCLNSPNSKTKSVRYVILVNKNMSDYLLPKTGNVEFIKEPMGVNFLKPLSAISEAKRFLLQEEAEALMSKVKEKTEEVKTKTSKKKKDIEPVEQVEVVEVVEPPVEVELLDSEVGSDQVEDQPNESSSQATDDEGHDFSREF
jgi:hypothetical protein